MDYVFGGRQAGDTQWDHPDSLVSRLFVQNKTLIFSLVRLKNMLSVNCSSICISSIQLYIFLQNVKKESWGNCIYQCLWKSESSQLPLNQIQRIHAHTIQSTQSGVRQGPLWFTMVQSQGMLAHQEPKHIQLIYSFKKQSEVSGHAWWRGGGDPEMLLCLIE